MADDPCRDAALAASWAKRMFSRLPESPQARLHWVDFGGEGVREAAINALCYTPAYANQARVAFATLADALTTLRFHMLAGCRFADSFEYIETGVPRIPRNMSTRFLILVNGPGAAHVLQELRRGLENMQRHQEIIYQDSDGPTICA